MIKLALLSVLIILCSTEININVKTFHFSNRTVVKYTGRDKRLVTDEEVALFNITHENLNRGVRKELGRVPDNIFLRDPTKYGNLFKQFKWPEVSRVFTIKSAQIIEFIQEKVIFKTHEHINNSTATIKSKTDMVHVVENTATSLWSKNRLPKDFIQCAVNIDFGYGNWNFNITWRDESVKTVRLPFGASKGIMDLKPGHTLKSQLLGLKVILLIEIEYTARLTGNILLDYDKLYGKYHFYSPAVENIMRAAEIKNEIGSKEYLEMRFYVDPKMELYDKDTREELGVKLKKHWRKKGMYNFE